MAANGPPRRAGHPDAYAEDKADGRRGKDPNPVFAVVAGVDEAEEGGGDPGGLPEAGALGLVQVQQQAGNQAQQRDDIDAPDAVALGAEEQAQANDGYGA